MIKINLLPEDLREREYSFANLGVNFKGQAELFRKLGIAVIVILAAAHIALFVIGINSSARFKAMTQKSNKLLPGRKESERLKAELEVINRKAQSIDVLMANRFSWARELNDLSDSIVQGIWLTDINYAEKPAEVSAEAKAEPVRSGGKKAAAKVSEKNKNVGYLNISGYASSMGEQGTALVGKFIKGMKDNPSFSSSFSEIKLESIKAEKFLDQEVMSFKITCQFKT